MSATHAPTCTSRSTSTKAEPITAPKAEAITAPERTTAR